jgi:hypothetical protein
MPDSLKEALRSDGTPFVVVSDADISAGSLLNPDGSPKYPIVISLASEATADNEIAPLLNYVSAGGFLLVGSASFTRNPDGTNRGDFALASAMGLHVATASLDNWQEDTTFTKQIAHRLVSHIPAGSLKWWMPLTAEDISWGIAVEGTTSGHGIINSPAVTSHYIWQTTATGATVIANGDNGIPYLAATPYGNGYFIYDAAMQPLLGNGGWAPGMHAYGIFRNAIQWAFESASLPIIKLSPWPYPYNAAYEVRHDFENFQGAIDAIEASAQAESLVGAKGDYYFCTGTLRVEMGNSPDTVASLQRAVSLYGATIGPHNGGLPNPNNPTLVMSDYDYWHWGSDEALDVQPPGYPSGSAYALASISQSYADIDGWLTGYEANRRNWVAPYFNGTREGSYQILEQLGVLTAGEQKLTPFPHWTVSTQTQGKRFSFVTLPVSDWFLAGNIAQSQETIISPPWSPWTTSSVEAAVDYYYGLGALVNLYSHQPSTNPNIYEYVRYAATKPSIWPVNSTTVYQWWTNRSPVQVTPSYAHVGNRLVATAAISGATDPDTAVELVVPNWPLASSGIQVKLNGTFAPLSTYRIYNQGIKVRVGTTVSSVQVSYPLTSGPTAQNDSYSVAAGNTLSVPAPGVLANDSNPGSGSLTATLATQPSNGNLNFNADGSFTYSPQSGFVGTDRFTYLTTNGTQESGVATVVITVNPAGSLVLFSDDFSGQIGQDPLWTTVLGTWSVANGVMNGSSPEGNYGFAYANRNWTDYSVQGQIRFQVGAYGGGIGGRVNAASGAHYGIWVYPEGSQGTSPLIKVIKFRGWATWGGTPMAQATLPSVGTAWHTLLVTFQSNNIKVSFDGVQYIDVTDNGFDSQPVYPSGGISLDLWTNTTPYLMSVENVSMQALSSAPVAQNDAYNLSQGAPLNVAAPGVLGNDSSPVSGGTGLTATLVSPPAKGTLSLQPNGSFTYAPQGGFTGTDSFTYRANDAGGVSNLATVMLTVIPAGSQVLFSDNFSGQSGPDPLWTTVTGTWSAANGTMSGSGPAETYSYAYANTIGNLTDYSVQEQIQFSPGAYGGGVGGQVNTTTGAHYGVWIFPERSGGPPVVKVIKFWSWTTWGGTPMAQATLPSVGTAWHMLLVTFHGNGSIQVSFDGVQYINVTDNNFDSRLAYTSGGTSLDMWTDTTPYLMSVANVLVFSAAPVAQNDAYNLSQGSTLSIAAPGVLGNDTGAGSTGLTATLVTPPANGTLSLQPDGSFSYTPVASFSGVDTFTYQANAGGLLSSTATVMFTVIPAGSQVLFSDNFSGPPGSDPLWTTVLGTWNVANGTMNGSSLPQNYAFAYASGTWADYSVQGQIHFPGGAYGGGIGGRVNAATGAHYGVWILPERSGGSPVVEVVKFWNWTTWGGTPMAQATLPSVGTAWHTLLVTFQGSGIQVSVDGVQYINVADNGFDSLPAYSSGGISLDMWTDTTSYAMGAANILVWGPSSVLSAQNDFYSVAQAATLNVAAPGVLGNDTGGGSTGLTTTLVSPPANGTFSLQPNGSFSYIPVASFSGVDTFTYQASAGGPLSNTATVTITVNAPPVTVASVSLNPTTVPGGSSSTGTVTLSSAAPTGGAVVTLTSSNTSAATVPASVTVAGGSNSATFAVTTLTVFAVTLVTVSGSYNTTQGTTLTVNPSTLSSVSLSPSTVLGGASSTGTVTLNGAAPTGGAVVTLTSNDPSATVPASVTVAAGATNATFALTTTAVATSTQVTISATYSATQGAILTINPATLSSVSLSPTTLIGGASATGTVTLGSAAPASGAVVTLTSNNTSATVPASVTIAAGATSATFTVTTSGVGTTTPVTISGTYNGTQGATLTINPATLSSVSLSPNNPVGGASSTGTVTLSGSAPTGGDVVTLTSNNTSVAAVPASVTVPAGATTATFIITTVPVAANTTVSISSTFNGTTRSANLTVRAATPSSVSLSPNNPIGGASSTGTVTLNGAALPGGDIVTLTSSNTSAAVVPASVTVPAGATTATFTITTTPVTANTSVTISAAFNGTTRTATLTVRAATPSLLSLSPTSVTGGNSSTGTVTLNGAAPASGAVVTLTSNNTAVATVPASVTVPAGATTATFTITTTPVATNTSVTISAALNGTTRNASLTVNRPALTSVTLSPSTVTGGTSSTGTVTLNGPAPSAGTVVTLSDNSSVASEPASVTVPGGATTATFAVTTTTVTATTSVSVSATLNGTTRSATLTVTP